MNLKFAEFLDPSPQAPLAILVHGRAGDMGVMSIFRNQFPKGWSFLLPQAPLADSLGGWSWWQFDAPRDQIVELADRQVEHFEQWLGRILRERCLTPRRIVGIGFSQGAALLSRVSITRSGLLQGVGLLAGFVVRSSDDQELIGSALPRVFMAHGRRDETIPVEVAERGAAYLADLGFTVELHLDDTGHKIGSTGMRELRRWVKEEDRGLVSNDE